jgi:hypothetical protein
MTRSSPDEKGPSALEDAKPNVKTTLAALWIALMFLYAYADILGFYRAENVNGVLAGELGGMEITPLLLVGSAILMMVPIAMIVLSLMLRATADRWTNLIVGVAYGMVLAVTVATGEISENTAYYVLIAAAEAVVLVLILWHAWRRPTYEGRD